MKTLFNIGDYFKILMSYDKPHKTKVVPKVDLDNIYKEEGYKPTVSTGLKDEVLYGSGVEKELSDKSFDEILRKELEKLGEKDYKNSYKGLGEENEETGTENGLSVVENYLEPGNNTGKKKVFNSPNYGFGVSKQDMSPGLFGWTRTGSGKVHVSNNLYKVDEEKTVQHEIMHLLHPGKDELTIRYLNGDTDPENTLSANYTSGMPDKKISYS